MGRLFSWLLNLAYLLFLLVCAPLIVWTAVRTGKYREGYREKFLGLVPRRDGDAPCVWIHAVSVGEVNLLATLLRELRAARPDWTFVVSTTSRTGYTLARQKYADLSVFYCPLDFSWAVRTAMRRVRPAMLVLAELELWPNLIQAAKEQAARVVIVNGRMSDTSFPGYRRIRPLVGRVLRKIDLIAAQNDESAARFRALGAIAERVVVTGSLKYDGAQTDRANAKTAALARLADIVPSDVVFLAGSAQEPEEEISLAIFKKLSPEFPQLRLVLVPRHPERFDAVAKLLEGSGVAWVRRSRLASQPPAMPGVGSTIQPRALGEPPAKPGAGGGIQARRPAVLLVDTVGELGGWWGTAEIAFVGGSFGTRGGQNMIEPAAYGAAVSFGAHTRNFRDIVATLLAAEAAVVVADAAALEAFVRRCLAEPAYATSLGARARALVESQFGATRRTVALLEGVLSERSEAQKRARSAA